MRRLWPLARPILHTLNAETAHDLTVKALAALPVSDPPPGDPRLAVQVFGLPFANPIGLAAGFDKNGMLAHKVGALGFGFVEIGTLTPKPQAGNPKPRLFRLPEQGGIINRFGFNNIGHAGVHRRLRKGRALLGVNIGANKDAEDRIADYVAGIRAFVDVADFFTVNVSSPNTPGLRDLQAPAALDELLARVLDARDAKAEAFGYRPVLLKISPDVTLDDLDAIVGVARRRRVDGMVVSNTTVARPLVFGLAHADEPGGLSGRPLFELSTVTLAQTFLRVERQFPLVGVGGIHSARSAWAKIEAGASLVQIYSALVFKGPALIGEVEHGLLENLGEDLCLASVVGRRAETWAATGRERRAGATPATPVRR